MRRVPNLRMLLFSAVAAGLIGGVGHSWHAFQLRRNAAALLRRVDRSLEQGEQTVAMTRLRQYLKLRPDDAGQQIRLAQLVDRRALTRQQKEEALRLHTLAIGLAPENADLLRRRAELSYELDRFAEAIRQADDLLRKDDDAGAVRVKALALAAQARLTGEAPGDRVAELFERALKDSPGDIELALELARIYRAQMPLVRDGDQLRREERASLADRVMKRLIETSPRSPDAFLARYQYRQFYGLAGADDDLRQALALDSEGKHFSVWVAAGLKQLAQGAAEKAAGLFDRAIAANRHDERGYLGLGRARDAAGDPVAAQAAWRQGLRASDASSPALNFELARSLVADGKAADAAVFLDRLESELRRRAGQMTPELRGQWLDRAAVLRADWHFAQGDFVRAAELLEDLSGRLAGAEEVGPGGDQHGARLYARLAAARGRLGQWDRAITQYQKSVAHAPHLVEHRLALADAYQRAGRLDDAVDQFRQLLKLDALPPGAWVLAARAMLEQQLALPSDQRQWDEFEQRLKQARHVAPDEPELALLDAERDFAEDKAAEDKAEGSATRLMQCVAASQDGDFCERACAVLQRWGRLEEADRCLQQARRGGLPEGRQALTAAALSAARGNLAESERVLRAALDAEAEGGRAEIGLRLALVLLAAGKAQHAKDELELLHRRHPGHLRVVQLMAELAWEESDLEALELNERRLRKLEGPEGTLWRFFRGLRLSIEADESDGVRLAAAERLQAEIERARPNWPATFLLKGRLADRQKRSADAIAAYFHALRLGERREQVYAYLATRLYQQGRYSEAQAVLEEMKARQPLSISLSGLELALEVRAGDLESATAAARRQVDLRPDDTSAHVWLGQILQIDNQSEEAAAALRRGIELAPTDARPWIALIQHYLAARDVQQARKTFDDMQAQVVVSARQRPFLMAQCHELLGDRDLAASYYQQALVAAPDAAAVWQNAARFYGAFDRPQAETYLRRVIELRPEAALARRMLAALVAEREGEAALADAAELLESQSVDRADRIVNQRLQARLALRHGDPKKRQEAQRLLEELLQHDQSPAPRDRLLLAQWYEHEGRLRAAKDQLLALALADQPVADHVASLVEFLLRHERADEAGEWLDQLSQMEPENASLRSLSLRVAWSIQRGERAQVETAIDAFLRQEALAERNPPDRATTWSRIAALYDAAQLQEQAETSYRRAASEHVSGACCYARWLAANDRVGEAIQLCLAQASSDATPQTAITLAAVLGVRTETESVASDVEPLFAQWLRRHPTSAMLRASLGTLRMLQGDSSTARELFEEALVIQPDHLVALNNLAMLLADDPARREEAMSHLDRALVLAGRHPELLDSKGWLLLQSDEAATAEPLFREAAGLAPGDPRPNFHLALSCWLQGKTDEARQALARARQRKLSANQLNPPERRRLAELELAFGG